MGNKGTLREQENLSRRFGDMNNKTKMGELDTIASLRLQGKIRCESDLKERSRKQPGKQLKSWSQREKEVLNPIRNSREEYEEWSITRRSD